ncbi:hypothetical protein [Chelatococcus reniformis]|nr:hypothetical protein [Chelatococcus reniformis]
MLGSLLAAAAGELAALRRRAIRTVAGVAIALAGAVILLVALLNALFLLVAHQWEQGPLIGHLAVAGVGLLVVVIALAVAFSGGGRPSRSRAGVTANSAAAQAFEAARAAGEQARGLGKKVAGAATGGESSPLVSRKMLANATLAAVIIGLFLGRRF